MKTKVKTYVLTVSRTFPKYHKRAGQDTLFVEKIACALFCNGDCDECNFKQKKIHTIRANYDLWAKRIEQVQNGEAIISLRYWSGKPYNTKQIEFCQLDKDSSVGVQKLEFYTDRDEVPRLKSPLINNFSEPEIETIAHNDGLSYEDFKELFKIYDISEPMAIIQFTDFRY